MSNTELRHWGIKGQKWGIRRFQNPDGSLTPAGKKRYDDDSTSKSSTKDEAMRSGKATEVAKFKSQMSNEELQRAVNRINLERQLADLEGREVQTGVDKFNSVMDKVGKVTNGVEKGLGAYNLVAKIYNSFSGDKKLPVIDGGQHAANVANEAAKKAKEVAEVERKKYIDSLSADDAVKAINNRELNAEEIASVNKRLSAESQVMGKAGVKPAARPATNNDDDGSATNVKKVTSNDDDGPATNVKKVTSNDDDASVAAENRYYERFAPSNSDSSTVSAPRATTNQVSVSEARTELHRDLQTVINPAGFGAALSKFYRNAGIDSYADLSASDQAYIDNAKEYLAKKEDYNSWKPSTSANNGNSSTSKGGDFRYFSREMGSRNTVTDHEVGSKYVSQDKDGSSGVGTAKRTQTSSDNARDKNDQRKRTYWS